MRAGASPSRWLSISYSRPSGSITLAGVEAEEEEEVEEEVAGEVEGEEEEEGDIEQ